jgi:hypothetical protein
MKEYEKKISSQQGEDGIIEHIFSKIGTTNKVAVEFGVAANPSGISGGESNTLNLAVQGWQTFWFDGAPINNLPAGCTFKQAILTPDNICDIFEEVVVPKDLDLLSIDVDGNDYHLREKLSGYNPRVVIMEYNGSYDGVTEYIMPHNDNYSWQGVNDRSFGASLLSLTQQADRLGYDLVYCDQNGVNAFYVRKDINPFPVKTSQEAWIKLIWTR